MQIQDFALSSTTSGDIQCKELLNQITLTKQVHYKHDKFQRKSKRSITKMVLQKLMFYTKRAKVARVEQLSEQAKKNAMISSQVSFASSPSL
jgi:hypothetical protein